ncbi:hypothetical protein UlMin_024800 [Ulmus minor]
MAKFNEVQKKKRAQAAERKRAIHGDPSSGKLKARTQPQSLSGKRKQKLLKKWRREQKDAVDKGLITMEDVEMAAADGEETQKGSSTKFPVKKGLKVKQLKRKGKGKNKRKSSKAEPAAAQDAMVE